MYWLDVCVCGVTRCVDQMEMPWLRSPCGAPVPAFAQPTSRTTVDGGVQVTNCHRSTFSLKLPAWANRGGGTKSSIHRPTLTPFGSRSVRVGVVASRGSPASVFLWT